MAERPDGSSATPAQPGPSRSRNAVSSASLVGVPMPSVAIAPAMGDQVLRGAIEHGRGMIDRGIDEAVMRERVAPADHQTRIRLERRGLGLLVGELGLLRHLLSSQR